MKILIDILHPAHFHRLKHYMKYAQAQGDELLIVARDKEVVARLLQKWGFSFVDSGIIRRGTWGRIQEYTERTNKIFSLARTFKPDVLVGGDGFSIGPVGRMLGIPSVSLSDTEDQGMIPTLAYHAVTHVVTPSCFMKDFGKRHTRFSGYYEMTYLHSKRFTPDPKVPESFGVKKGEKYSMIRFVSWDSCHDEHEEGLRLEERRQLVQELSKYGKVFINSEGKVPEEFASYTVDPVDVHSLLYYAHFYFGDSQTMSIEAGLLGTPAIRCNSLVNKLHAKGQFNDFHYKYGIVYSYASFADAFAKLKELMADPERKEKWKEKRQKIETETEDFTDFFHTWLHKNFNSATGLA